MARPLTFRLATAGAAAVFATMGGVAGFELHPLSSHGLHSGDLIAMELGTVSRHHLAPWHMEHHSHHPPHGSSSDCTCVGPCQGGVAPTAPDQSSAAAWLSRMGYVRVAPPPVRAIRQDPTAYLLPLPNPPPARV